jgi:CMP-N,N'-diacetyllegionaminic acid synthase
MMLSDKSILALITARGASKRVPGKNLVDIGGKPLIAWTVEAAQKSKYIDRVILSSDATDIIDVAEEFGCEVPFRRPVELATDTTSSAEVIIHALDNIEEEYDYLVLLQPTSPFRIAEDIDDCLEVCIKRNAPSAVSLNLSDKPPAWMYTLDTDGGIQAVTNEGSEATRKQDIPDVYVLNGAVFVSSIEHFRKAKSFLGPETLGLPMPAERSIDIDTSFDVSLARALISITGLPK